MLKISQAETLEHDVTLRLEGRIVGPWVMELQRSCEDVLRAHRPLKLHLAGVEFTDASGVGILADLQARGVLFLECPPFTAEQLRMHGRS